MERSPATTSNFVNTICVNENSMMRGAIFCQVAIINPCTKGRPCSTSGNQKWQGARPNLNASAALKHIAVTFLEGSRIDQDPASHACIRAPFSSSAALRACIRKYFILASIFRGANFEHKTGTKANVLISSPTQIINHFSVETTIRVPDTIVKQRKMETVRFIELEGNLALNNLIIS